LTDVPVLTVEALVKHFPLGHGRAVKAVNGISFQIDRGEALALVGESGSGKTTVGRCVLRLIEPTSGAISFRGEDILAMAPEQFRQRRRHLQLVFQEPYDSLNPRMRVGRILDEPMMLAGRGAPTARSSRAHDLLDIATDPDLVVLDEPTSALDVSVRAEILDLLVDLQARLGFAYLFISHDLTAVRRVCQRVAVMYLGRIVETARTSDIFERPLHPYSRALLSSVLYPDPAREQARFLLTGEIPSPIDLPPGCPLYARCPWARPACDLSVPPLEALLPDRHVACFRAREENGIGAR